MSYWVRDEFAVKGASLSVKVLKKIDSVKSKFQQIDIYETEKLGKMLMHDDVIMLTESDEFAYHEMLVHVPMHVHPNPKKVLIVGGGDGGTAREVLKHSVDGVDVCEIDGEVIEVCKKHFPSMASSFDDSRVKVFLEDAAEFIKGKEDEYDVILVDSSDPIGPATVLFTEEFYRNLNDALKEDGILATQSESMYYNQDTISQLVAFNKNIFPVLSYYYTLVPTYPSGTIGFSFCSKKYKPSEFVDKGISDFEVL